MHAHLEVVAERCSSIQITSTQQPSTELETKEEWSDVVQACFNPQLPKCWCTC